MTTLNEIISRHRHIMMTILTLLIGIILYMSALDDRLIYAKPGLILFGVIFSLLSFMFLFIKMDLLDFIFARIVVVVFSVSFVLFWLFYYLYTIKNGPVYLAFQYISILLFLLVSIITLAIVYKMFVHYFIKLGGISRIIVLVLFFLPCLLNSIIEFILREYSNTTNEVIVLLFLEIIAIISYYYINYKLRGDNKKKKELVVHAMFLDNKASVTVPSLLLHEGDGDDDIDDVNGRRRYSISMWVSINTDVSNHYSVPLLCYAENTPLITYDFDDEKRQNVFTFQFNKNNNQIIKINLPPQKWHLIVVTYEGNSASLYCNGILSRTVDLREHLPIYSMTDTIKIGGDAILNGAISKVNYFTYELSLTEIEGMYYLGL